MFQSITESKMLKKTRWSVIEMVKYQTKYGEIEIAGKQLEPREKSGLVGEITINLQVTLDEYAQLVQKFAPESQTARATIEKLLEKLGIEMTREAAATDKTAKTITIDDIRKMVLDGLETLVKEKKQTTPTAAAEKLRQKLRELGAKDSAMIENACMQAIPKTHKAYEPEVPQFKELKISF